MNLYQLDDKSIVDICLNAPYITRICLKFTCKRFNDIIIGEALNILPIIKLKLKKHFDEEETNYFIKLISKYGIISGSFILSCIYDNDWYNDIDIYEDKTLVCNEWKEKHKKFEMIEDGNRRRQKRIIYHKKFFLDGMINHWPWYPGNLSYEPGQYTRLSRFLYRPDNYDCPPYYEESHYARNFKINDMMFQHIIVESNPTKYIKNTFDMDICKNYYDGKNLYVWSWDKLINKKDYIKPNAILLEFYLSNDEFGFAKDWLEGRIINYATGGSYTPESAIESIFEKCLNKSEMRMVKYKDRKFELELHPNYKEIFNYIFDKKRDGEYAYELLDEIDLSTFL